MALQSKMVVYAAIGGLFAMMGAFVLYAGQDNPELERVEVGLVGVEVLSVDRASGDLRLETTFMISNPGDKTFTIPLISYDVSAAGGERITSGQYSTEDIAMPGRAAFYPGAEIPLKSTTSVGRGDVSAGLYDSLVAGGLGGLTAEGVVTVESAWSVVEKEFSAAQ